VACRRGEWPAYQSWFGDIPALELEPLRSRAVRDVVRRKLPISVAEAALAWVERDHALSVAVRRPLALDAFLQVALDRHPNEWRRRNVLDALLEAFLATVPSIERPAYRTALADVALRCLDAELPVEVDTVAMALGVTRDDMIRTGVVEASGAKLAFVEPLLAHHCAAGALARHAASNPRQLAEHLGDLRDARRADTLVHVYNLAPDPVDFLAALLPLEGGPEIAARCLAEPDAADPGGPAGSTAVVEGLVAGIPPMPVRALYRLGDALARAGQRPAAEVALRSALARTDGDVDLEMMFERTDVDAAPPVVEWVKEFVRERNRGLAYRIDTSEGDAGAALALAADALGRLDAEVTFERGLAFLEAGKSTDAIEALAAAVEAEPARARYLFHYGRVLVAVARADEAVDVLRRARDAAPDQAPIEAALGEAYLQLDWLLEATNCFERAAALDPTQPQYIQAVGELTAETGDLAAAADRMRAAISVRPDQAAWHDGLGQVLFELGEHLNSAAAFRAAHELDPERPDLLRRLGRSLSAAGQHDAALNAFRRALALQPEDPAAKADLAHALAAAGESDAAIHGLKAAIVADGNWPADHLLLARLLRGIGDLDGSLRHAQTAVDLAPASVRALTELGRVYQTRGEDRQAEDLYRRAARRTLREGPLSQVSDAAVRPAAADGYGATDLMGVSAQEPSAAAELPPAQNTDAGVERLAQLASQAPHDPEILKAYGLALRAAGFADKAIGVLRRAARLSPMEWVLLWELARTALILGRQNEARYAVGAALELQGDQARLYGLLGDIEASAGNIDAAADAYVRALALDPTNETYALRAAELGVAIGDPSAAGQGQSTLATASADVTSPAMDETAPHALETTPAGVPTAKPEHKSPAETIAALEALVVESGATEPLLRLAAAYYADGRIDDALDAYGRVAENDGGPDACLKWSQVALDAGAMDDAIEGARMALAARPSWAAAYASLARAYARSGLPEAAMTAIGRAVALEPHTVQYRVDYGDVAMALGRLDEAVEGLQEGLHTSPESAPLHHSLGLALERLGHAGDAEAAFESAAELDPANPVYHKELARIFGGSDHRGAAAALRRVLDLDATDHEATFELALVHASDGDDESARRLFARAVRLAPGIAAYHRALGLCLARLGEDGAAGHFEDALAIEPEVPGTLADLAGLLADEGRRSDAIQAFEKAVRLDPDNADYWRRLGQLYLAEGDAEAAVSAFTEAVRADPGDGAAHRTVGMALEALGRPEDAARAYEQAARIDPRDGDTLVRLGHARTECGDAEGAVEALERALAIEPHHGGALVALAEAVLSRGRIEAALGYGQRATEASPDDPAAWHALARAARAIGDLELAADALARAAELDPADSGTHRLLGELAEDRGDREGALASYRDLALTAPHDVEGVVHFGELVAEQGWLLVPVAPETPPAIDPDAAATAAAALEAVLRPDDGPTVAREPRQMARAARALALLRGRLGDAPGAMTAARSAVEFWETPDNLVTAAWAELAAGDPAAALESLGLARALEADGADVHMLTAAAHAARGDYSLAAEAYRLAAARSPRLAAAHAGLAAMHASLGRSEKALGAYHAALDLEWDPAWCRELGRLALHTGQLEEALDALTKYTTLHPDDAAPRRDLAMVLYAAGDVRGAIENQAAAVGLEPERADWQAELGDLHRGRGDFEAAHAAYTTASELEPDRAEFLLADAAVLLDERRTDDARKKIEAALAADPNAEEGQALLGRIALAEGNLEAASEAFEKALRRDSSNPAYHFYMGVAAKSAGELDRALEHFESAARLDSADHRTYLALGELYQQVGAMDDAIQALEQAAVSDRQGIEAHMRLGELCTRLGMTDKALAHYQRAAEAAPRDYRPRQGMAHAYLAQHDLESAVAAFEDAIDKHPKAAEVYFDAGMAYKKLRDYGRAASMFKKATRLAPGSAAAYTQLAAVSALHFLDRSGGAADTEHMEARRERRAKSRGGGRAPENSVGHGPPDALESLHAAAGESPAALEPLSTAADDTPAPHNGDTR
jgi:cellulose synthase operon protein C